MLLAIGGCRSEVDLRRAVRIGLDRPRLAPHIRFRLIGLEHRAGLIVVRHHRPEPTLGDVGWERQAVVAGPVEELAVAAACRHEVCRADAGEAHAHRRGDSCGDVEEPGAWVELAGTIAGGGNWSVRGDRWRRVEELVTADEEPVEPGRVGIVEDAVLGAGRERDRPGGRVPDHDCLFEDLSHALVGVELLAVDDAHRSEQTQQLRIAGTRWLLLHQLVDDLPETEVVGVDGVEHLPGSFDELRLGRRRSCPKGRFPGQERGDRGALGTRHVGGYANTVADRVDRDLGIVVDHESSADQGHPCGAGVEDVEAAVGQRTVVAGSHEQVPTARPTVRAGEADVGHPPEPHVIDRPEEPRGRPERRHVEHHRAVGQVDEAPEVDRVAVGGQEQRRRVHPLREEQERVVLGSGCSEAATNRGQRCTRQRADERLDAVHEVEVVVEQGRRRFGRCAVVELQRSETTLDLVGRRDRPQRLRRNPGLPIAHRVLLPSRVRGS